MKSTQEWSFIRSALYFFAFQNKHEKRDCKYRWRAFCFGWQWQPSGKHCFSFGVENDGNCLFVSSITTGQAFKSDNWRSNMAAHRWLETRWTQAEFPVVFVSMFSLSSLILWFSVDLYFLFVIIFTKKILYNNKHNYIKLFWLVVSRKDLGRQMAKYQHLFSSFKAVLSDTLRFRFQVNCCKCLSAVFHANKAIWYVYSRHPAKLAQNLTGSHVPLQSLNGFFSK